MYPKMIIDLPKLKANLDAVAHITKEQGKCSMMIVTKALCADPEMAKLVCSHPAVDFLADSRTANIATYSDIARKNGKKTVLLRLPMHCEVEDVVKYVDISFNSELSTLELLNKAAEKAGVVHGVVLMIDLGDLREGIFYKDEALIYEAIEKILAMKNLKLCGVGVNLTCYGAIIPKRDNLSLLVEWAHKIEAKYQIKLDIVSGGNSSSIYLIWKEGLPEGINNLRLGESFLLGNDTAYGEKVAGTTSSTITLEAQIIELKEKPSLPIGEVGVDAFGQKPFYEDRGIIKRAILGVGKQDINIDGLTPLDTQIDILGGSSDHTILDVSKCDKAYKVGDTVKFELDYGAMLKAATSKYVAKEYVR